MRARPGEGRRPVTFPRALARHTRGAVNTVTLPLAGHLAFADLEHACRKSGTVRHTPLRAFRSGNTVIAGLDFGRQPDWYQNIQAAGTRRMRLGGEQLTLGAPRSSPPPRASPTCPGWSGSRSGTWFTRPAVSSCPPCRHRPGRRPRSREHSGGGARPADGRCPPGSWRTAMRSPRRPAGTAPAAPQMRAAPDPRILTGRSGASPHVLRFPPRAFLRFPVCPPGSPPSPAFPGFPCPAFSGSSPSAVARFRFPLSVSLRVPLPLSNLHDSAAAGRFRRR